MLRHPKAFSLVELMIIVMLLAIMAMIVMPKFASSADETREAALATDYTNAIRQIDLYRIQHGERWPETDENGVQDTANFIKRMIGRTTFKGKLDPNGEFGPYLMEWPTNPFMGAADAASEIKFSPDEAWTRDGSTGWLYTCNTHKLYINSIKGGTDFSR